MQLIYKLLRELVRFKKGTVTLFSPMFHFYTSRKRQKMKANAPPLYLLKTSHVFRGYVSGTVDLK